MATLTATNVQTDATRTTATEGDGRATESSVGIWEATTNLETNGGFETNDTGWSQFGGSTIARSEVDAKFGSASLRVDTAGSFDGFASNGAANMTAAVQNDVHTISGWFNLDSADNLRLLIREYDSSDVAGTDTNYNNTVGATGWNRWSHTHTMVDADCAKYQVIWRTTGAATDFYADGLQAEVQPIATPYVETDGATAARTQSDASIVGTVSNEDQGWMACRVRVNYASTGLPNGAPRVWRWSDSGTDRIDTFVDGTNLSFLRKIEVGDDNAVSQAHGGFAVDDQFTFITTWDRASVGGASINGAAFTKGAINPAPTSITNPIRFGNEDGLTRDGDMDYFWVAGGTGTLTDAIAALYHGFGDTDKTVHDFNVGQADPTFFWAADTTTYLDTAAYRRGQLAAIGVG